MHTMWKGTISFGLVNIPIKLHAATENKDIKLRQLHEECKSPIEYKKRCPVCDKEISNEDIVKAYEYAKNKFVVLDAEDLENLKKEQQDKSVEILDFVKLEEIDPIYFDRSYFMSPNEGGTKAYGLLRQALSDTGKIGIAKIIIRSKEQLAIVRVYENTLIMETIHFPDEVRNVADVPNVPEQTTDLSKKEVSTAITLIDQLTAEFEPEKYTDEYRTALMELIEAKRNNEEVTTAKQETTPENVTNLMEALEKSLESTKESKKIAPKRKTAAKKTNRKKKTS
ncbi:Ku protein [Halobacillus sp. A1]|uniref:non-homologous end joining protein Ku n=1 Tax=Halobacillus sp. A1 TaxID=2880262 RepID=UPI0020A6243D|nr:Ku protein [Halobacillus sp. A1]MCP3030904.1 Ku protein [Halobacillus sp. A1]